MMRRTPSVLICALLALTACRPAPEPAGAVPAPELEASFTAPARVYDVIEAASLYYGRHAAWPAEAEAIRAITLEGGQRVDLDKYALLDFEAAPDGRLRITFRLKPYEATSEVTGETFLVSKAAGVIEMQPDTDGAEPEISIALTELEVGGPEE